MKPGMEMAGQNKRAAKEVFESTLDLIFQLGRGQGIGRERASSLYMPILYHEARVQDT